MNNIIKIVLTLIFIILLSILLTFIKLTLSGTDTIHIANYYARTQCKSINAFPLIALRTTFTRGIPFMLILMIPLIIVFIELYSQFGYTC